MTLTPRSRRNLAFLGVSAILYAVVYFWPAGGSAPTVVAPSSDPVQSSEKRLARLRDQAATVPQKEEVLKAVQAELAQREKGILQAPTAAQARARLLEILERLCASEAPPVKITSNELGGISPLGDAYGSVDLAVQIQCGIDQLVNLLAAIASQPELISTTDLRITPTSNTAQKTVSVRLAVSAVVSRKLVPEKTGASRL